MKSSPAFKSSYLRCQTMQNKDKPSPLCPFQITFHKCNKWQLFYTINFEMVYHAAIHDCNYPSVLPVIVVALRVFYLFRLQPGLEIAMSLCPVPFVSCQPSPPPSQCMRLRSRPCPSPYLLWFSMENCTALWVEPKIVQTWWWVTWLWLGNK